MRQRFEAGNYTKDDNNGGKPAGGYVLGTGLEIEWQRGPLGRVGTAERGEPNGAFVEDVIAAALQRIRFYQTGCDGRFACQENAKAIECLEQALYHLDSRTRRRAKDGTEGTHEELGDP